MKEPGDLLLWILAWLCYQLAQALFINGLFISAKGRTDKESDGTLLHSEMILYPLYRFLNQTVIDGNKEKYRFSKYLRKPIITCVICMASFWSIFTFVIPVIFIWGFNLSVAALCLANTVSLSYVNYLIFKPRK